MESPAPFAGSPGRGPLYPRQRRTIHRWASGKPKARLGEQFVYKHAVATDFKFGSAPWTLSFPMRAVLLVGCSAGLIFLKIRVSALVESRGQSIPLPTYVKRGQFTPLKQPGSADFVRPRAWNGVIADYLGEAKESGEETHLESAPGNGELVCSRGTEHSRSDENKAGFYQWPLGWLPAN